MDDDLNQFLAHRAPTPAQPLLGLTVLAVEDSRFASEALRLLCLRSGARIRRADCLASAQRHLRTYRPAVAIVDLGLPDGSGLDLIRELAALTPRVPVILATSGMSDLAGEALAAGADGFLEKPVESLAVFQRAILAALPVSARPWGPVPVAGDQVVPDPIALRDDLNHAAALLDDTPDDRALGYVAQFLAGVARVAHDQPLAEAAAGLGDGDGMARLSRLSGLVRDRLAAGVSF